MKHIDLTVKAPKETTIPLPRWWGHAVTAIRALQQDPTALDGFGVVDMDAANDPTMPCPHCENGTVIDRSSVAPGFTPTETHRRCVTCRGAGRVYKPGREGEAT